MDHLRKPGELGFAVLLLLISALFLALSIQLFAATAYQLSGPGGMPVIMSLLMVVFLVKVLLEGRSLPSGSHNAGHGILGGLSFVFSRDVLVFTLLILAYCTALYLNITFLLVTPVFLFASMQYLIPRSWKANLLYTLIVTAAVYLVFVKLFRVSLP